MGIVSVFGQTAPLGNGALLRDGTLESWAGRGEDRELVLRMRNRSGGGAGASPAGFGGPRGSGSAREC